MKYAITAALLLSAGIARADFTFEHDEHTYKVITTPATWAAARAAAGAMTLNNAQGYLAIIDSAEENDAILAALQSGLNEASLDQSRAADGGDAAFLWIGATDAAAEGVWIWDKTQEQFWAGNFNGATVNGRYANWGIEPDNQGNQDAGAFGFEAWPADFGDLGDSGQWNDLSAGNSLYYIVEFDSPAATFRLALEEPVSGETYSGVGNLRGWGFSTENIDRVEVYIDDVYAFDAPYGGARGDVAAFFSDVPNALNSGFALAVNYSSFGRGEHTVRIRAIDDFGNEVEQSVVFEVASFHKSYIPPTDTVDFSQSLLSAEGDEVFIQNAVIDGVVYDLKLEWRTAEQGLEIIGIEQLTSDTDEDGE